MDTLDLSVIDNDELRCSAEKLLLKCGIRADLSGFTYLTDAVILKSSYPRLRTCETYSLIGKVHSMRQKSIMRAISYAVDNAFGLPRRLNAMLDIDIGYSDIHNGLVISYLAGLMRLSADKIPD